MEKYKNEQYLKNEIMGQSRHQFIYGYDKLERKQFLEDMASDYSVVLDKDAPMAIYVTDIGFPKMPICSEEVDKTKLAIISREFLFFSIVSDILLNSKVMIEIDILNERLKGLISLLNRCLINRSYDPISDLEDLIKVLNESKEFYRNYYIQYCEKGIETLSINDVKLPFMQLEMIISRLKLALGNNSYFGLIIDKQCDLAISSIQAINLLVGSRINKDISMKVVTEPDAWQTYRDINGSFIESVHDYGTVELDDSYSQHLKRVRKDI